MTLTDPDLAYLRTQLGSTLDEADLQARADRLQSVVHVAHEVVSERLATLLQDPASFTLPGVLSVGTGENIKALQAQAAGLRAQVDAADAVAAAELAGAGGVNGRVVRHGVWR